MPRKQQMGMSIAQLADAARRLIEERGMDPGRAVVAVTQHYPDKVRRAVKRHVTPEGKPRDKGK